MKKFMILLSLIIISAGNLWAAYNRLGIPDSSEIRAGLTEKWFEAPLDLVRTYQPETALNQIGQEFQIRLEESEEFFYIFVSPHSVIDVTVYSNDGTHTEQRDVYPGDVAGSFVLIRSKATGNVIHARYYFLKDSDVYVQFSPYGRTAAADLVIFGNYAARGVSTGLPFSYYCSCSFEDVLNTTENKLPWKYVMQEKGVYHSIQQMIAVIDEALPSIQYTPDAMYDELARLVHISTGEGFSYEEISAPTLDKHIFLSSAGFLKWICDGLVEPIAGSMLKRSPLIQETIKINELGHQGVLSQKYSLYFSLDWIRNLASAVISVYTTRNYLFNQSGVDVTVNPFSSSISDSYIVTFIENTGYTVDVIKSLLYVLATTDPGTFYLGAIRETDRSVTPEVSVFNENVAFFPYFLDDGAFNCVVFMNGRKMELGEFCRLHHSDFVYLTKVKSNENFFPAK